MSVTKGLNTYDNVIFHFFFFNKFAKNSTFLGVFFCQDGGAEQTAAMTQRGKNFKGSE